MKLEEFYAIVDAIVPDANGCMIWSYAKDKDGYGTVSIRDIKGSTRVTRRVLERKLGHSLGNLQANHTCDNPACCNPGHLWAGTQKENVEDRNIKGRQAKGIKNGMFGRLGIAHPMYGKQRLDVSLRLTQQTKEKNPMFGKNPWNKGLPKEKQSMFGKKQSLHQKVLTAYANKIRYVPYWGA